MRDQDFEDPDRLSGCDVDFTKDPTSDEDLALVVLTGGSQDLDVIERKMNAYKELFPNA